MARLATHKAEFEDGFDVLRWVRFLIMSLLRLEMEEVS